MNPFERRLAKLEAEHRPAQAEERRIQFWHAPEGITDLTDQDAWFSAKIAADPEQAHGTTLNVCFVRHCVPELSPNLH